LGRDRAQEDSPTLHLSIVEIEVKSNFPWSNVLFKCKNGGKGCFFILTPSTSTMEVRALERESKWVRERKKVKLRDILVETGGLWSKIYEKLNNLRRI